MPNMEIEKSGSFIWVFVKSMEVVFRKRRKLDKTNILNVFFMYALHKIYLWHYLFKDLAFLFHRRKH